MLAAGGGGCADRSRSSRLAVCVDRANAPRIILNQNAYQTFAWATEKYHVNPYTRPEVLGVIVGLEDSRQYLTEVFPSLPVMRLRVSVDGRLFQPNTRKLKQIAFMPRKKEADARQVLAITRFRGR